VKGKNMSREFYQAVALMHEDNAKQFAANADGKSRHVECRISDVIYVYLIEDGVHIQTQHVDIPDPWWENWPSDATVRRLVHRYADIGNVRITSLDA
jgi:hypothetical protein